MKYLIFTQAIMTALLTVGISRPAVAQGDPVTATTIKLAVNPEYDKAGKLKRIIWGDHYRKEWATVVELPVLDMNQTGGGLTPIKKGGGFQTRSLRLQGANGKEYVLRSVNKDPSAALPEALRGTFADDMLQDQISSANPYAPMVVASLSEAAGIFHTNPQMVYVPASNKLAEYRQEFGESIYLFEERPSSSKTGNPAFGYSKSIYTSGNLFERLVASSTHRVDEKAFLKARLFDMWIGDWDRHEDQWLWAGFKTGDKTIYRPIPRDRDQAFSNLDGAIPQIATKKWAIRKLESFGYKIQDVNGLNTSGNPLDRLFTTTLTRKEWLQIAAELQATLTDAVIKAAVHKMPAAIFDISGNDIISKLKKRRDDLEQYTREYYAFLTREINITGTQQQEVFEVKRINNDSTLVTVYATNVNNERMVIYKRVLQNAETKEIRLYGFDGKDQFHIDGKVNKGILIRVIAGKAVDEITDNSTVKELSYKMKIYDEGENIIQTDRKARVFITDDSLKNEFKVRSSRYDVLTLKYSPGYNPDDGMYVGGGIVFKKHQFGKEPYGHMQSVWANYAFATGAYNFGYEGIFKDVVDKWDLHLNATINAPNYVRNYYGLGNDTKQLVDDNKYYRLRSDQIIISSAMYKQFAGKHTLGGGIEYDQIKLRNTEGRFVSESNSKLDSADFGRKHYTAAFVNYQFSILDNTLFPKNGVRIKAGAKYTRNMNESKSFVQLTYESSLFLTAGRWTAALRSGAATNLKNEYEFFQANSLGGSENLRGFRRDRFAGKSSLYNNTELRFKIKSFKGYMLGGEYGLLSFVDNGRVWIPNESSSTWHYGYGGGVWVLIYNRIPITATYGVSKEDKLVNVKAGFLF